VLVGYELGYQANSAPLHLISNADPWNIEKCILKFISNQDFERNKKETR